MHCLICFASIDVETTWGTLFTEKEENICGTCKEKFERIDATNHYCQTCMKPISTKVNTCGDCLSWQERTRKDPLTQNISIYQYTDDMKDLMVRFKYRGDYEIVHIWKQEITQTYQYYFGNKKLTIVPVPLSEERMKDRGFNQAEALAQLIATPENLLHRQHSEKQSKKTKRERVNSSNPFRSRKRNVPHQILLVDDIYTTGTTLRQAAQVLLKSGAEQIFSLTLIRS